MELRQMLMLSKEMSSSGIVPMVFLRRICLDLILYPIVRLINLFSQYQNIIDYLNTTVEITWQNWRIYLQTNPRPFLCLFSCVFLCIPEQKTFLGPSLQMERPGWDSEEDEEICSENFILCRTLQMSTSLQKDSVRVALLSK